MSALRVAGLDLMLVVAGLGILYGCGLVRSTREAARFAGLAFVLGFAGIGVLLTLALVVGHGPTVPVVVAAGAALAVAGAALGRRKGAVHVEDPPRPRQTSWIAVGALAVGAVYLAWILRTLHAQGGTTAWDAWGFWIPKAKALYFFGGLDTGVGGFTSLANPDYPPLLPAFDAAVFHFAGRPDATLLPVQEWLLSAAFLWGLGALLWRRIAPPLLAVALLLMLLMPEFGGAIGLCLGDLPLSILLGTAAVALALWLLESEPPYLLVAAVALAGAAVTKKEGLVLALLLVVVTGVARRSRQRLAPLVVVGLVALAATLPWRLWVRAHHIPANADYRLSNLLDPGFLSGRWGRLGTSADRVPQYLFDLGRWELVLPLALLAGLVVRRRVGTMVVAFTALALLGLIAIYWISFLPIEFHLESSANRTVMPIVVVGGALLPLLLAEVFYPRRASSDR